MRSVVSVVVAVAVMAGGTVLVGWWALPVLGVGWGVVENRSRYPGLLGALAGALAWAGLLAYAAVSVGIDQIAVITGGVLGVPAAASYALTIAFAALLAGSAATVGGALRGIAARGPRTDPASL